MKTKFCTITLILVFIIRCGKEEMMDTVMIENVNLTLVKDGIYQGDYTDTKSKGYAKVQAKVNNHYIEKIDIIDRQCSPVGKKGEYIINDILKKQSLNIDAIAGATITSTVILKATEIALNKGVEYE